MVSKNKRYNKAGVKYYKRKKKNGKVIENKNGGENIKVNNDITNKNETKDVEKAIEELFENNTSKNNEYDKIDNEEKSNIEESLINGINAEIEEDKLVPVENKNFDIQKINKDSIYNDLPPKEIDFKDNNENLNTKNDDIEKENDDNAFLDNKGIDSKNDIENVNMNRTIDFQNLNFDEQNSNYENQENENNNKINEVNNNDFESNTNVVNNNKIYLDYKMRLLLNVIGIIVFFILALVLFIVSISIKARSNVLYKQNSNLDYKVYLKQNDYFKETYLNKNMQYIASLIDNIDVDFNYNFSANQNINYKYTYYVNADVLVTDTQDESKIIYSKSNKMTEPKTIANSNSNGFSINEDVKVNYQEYNDIVKSFKSSYGISANSNLVLSLCIEIEDEKGNIIRSLDSSDTMKLTIPLTEQMVNIKMDYKEVNNSNNAKIYKDFSISNKTTFIISILSLIISIGFLIKLFIFIKKTTVKKTAYDVTLAKILREYDRVIVNSKKIVDLDNNSNIIDVNNFSELLDVRDNLEKPIIFSEIHKGQKSIFIVKTATETYRYVLKLADLEKNK